MKFYPVLFNEIDINQHFNTGRYLERINNNYSLDFQSNHKLTGLEVNFMREGLPDDSLAVNRQEINSNEHLCSVIRKGDGAELIKAKLMWEGKGGGEGRGKEKGVSGRNQ
jgi:medium-chain acyl-[acyl-carrier-protein] hydrolase